MWEFLKGFVAYPTENAIVLGITGIFAIAAINACLPFMR